MRTTRRLLVGIITLALAFATLTAGGGGAQAATAAALSATVKVDVSRAKLTRITGYGPDSGFRAVFSKPYRFKKRVVSLQRLVEPVAPADPVVEGETAPVVAPARWVEVARAKMDSKGQASFTARPIDGATYRAVADTFKYKVKKKKRTATPVATNSVVAVAPAPTVTYSFNNGAGGHWAPRNGGLYGSAGRLCSAPFDDHVSYTGGRAVLRVTKAGKAATAVRHAAAKAAQSAAGQKRVGCTYGSFRNAMISTQGTFTASSGTVSARVKFPLGQGMHAGMWLQSAGAEVDIIESFGYGKGLTSTVHVGGRQYPAKDSSRYVAKSTVKKKSWWSAYHVVTARWSPTEVKVWIDGKTVQTITNPKPGGDYFLVLSLLSSDWETRRMTKPVKGAKGVKKTKLSSSSSKFYVDWIKVWAA